MKKMFWCDKCGVPILLMLSFKKDGVIKIAKTLPISSLEEGKIKSNDLVLSWKNKKKEI